MASLIVDNSAIPLAKSQTMALAIEASELWEGVQAALQGFAARTVIEQRDLRNWPALLERLERLRPGIVLLDITHLPQGLEASVRSVRAAAPDGMLVVLDLNAEPETILTAIRCGANEFLYPPLEANLRKALERRLSERPVRDESNPAGKVMGFLSAKGGSGATTIACHLAVELGRICVERAETALLADLDLESGIVGFLMKAKSPYSILDGLENLHRLDLSYWNALVTSGWPGLEIIVAPSNYLPREVVTGAALRRILAFARSSYAWTIADLGCALSPAILDAVPEMDEVYLVTTLEVPALHRAKQIVQTLMNRGDGERLRLILNRTPQRPDVSAEELERILGRPIHTMLPNDYYSLYDAFCKGKLLAPGSHLNRQIAALAMRLAGVPAEKNKRRFGIFG